MPTPPPHKSLNLIERITRWVGSPSSLVAHTVAFLVVFTLGLLHLADWDTVLLVLTTVVSLEAIYLAIFIQMTVNQNTESLREVEENVDEIQKDIDAIEQDVDEIQEDDADEQARHARQQQALEDIGRRLQQLVNDLGKIK